MEKVYRTHCARMDHGGCGLLVTVKDGQVTKVEGDPDSPISFGFVCPKGLAAIERLHHPHRLTRPLLRVGSRGEGRWRAIGWDEALEILSRKIREVSQREGPNSIVFAQGAPKGLEFWLMMRLANVIGSPNVAGIGNMCHMPREISSVLTFGFWPEVDYDHPPRCIVLWGSNLDQTNEESTISSRLRRALDRGSSLIIVDPRPTRMTSKARIWLRPRPGTDVALAMGMMRVMVEEGLVDMEFVRKWTVGFQELAERLKDYPLERVEEITWVPAHLIREAARLYSKERPSAIQMGNALEHTTSAHQACRAVACLMALSGNLEEPGGNVRPSPPALMRLREFVLMDRLPERRKMMLSGSWNFHPLLATVPAQLATKAFLEGDPHPIKMAYLQGTNPLLSYPNSNRVRKALEGLEFLAVAEIFMTPTAALADLVLPVATHMEFDDIGNYGLPKSFVLGRPKIVDPPGEAWSDIRILNQLGRRLGFKDAFWEDEAQILDAVLSPSGLTYEEFKERLILWGERTYRSYIQQGFRTPSGKVELRCDQLRERGLDPLPGFEETTEAASSPSKDYPFILTSAKNPVFFHSAWRQIPSLRKIFPEPFCEIAPETAALLGIGDGEWIWIRTEKGSIRQKAKIVQGLDPRVVCAAYGWWYPERGYETLFGWKDANINVLTCDSPPFDPLVGSVNLRGIPCALERAKGDG
jgi:anaerobic selenocysteine-containing dehydrogenase